MAEQTTDSETAKEQQAKKVHQQKFRARSNDQESPPYQPRPPVVATLLPPALDQQGRADDDEIQPGAYGCNGMEIVRHTKAQWSEHPDEENTIDCSSNHTQVTSSPDDDNNNNNKTTEQNLALAVPIGEEDEGNNDLPTAEHYDPKATTPKSQAVTVVGFLVGIGIVGVIVSLALVQYKTRLKQVLDKIPSIPKPTLSPAEVTLDYPLSIFPESSVMTIQTDETSPQFQAYQWLLDDPHLETYPTQRLLQRFALATFFFATGGPTFWINSHYWLSYDDHECDWYTQAEFGHSETTTDGTLHTYAMGPEGRCSPDGSYLHFWLYVNGLHGSIPEEFYLLTDLKSIDMSLNQKLSGTLSTSIGQLTNLDYVWVASDSLTGTIPTQIGLLSKLQGLFTYENNQLGGPIPTQMGLMKELQYFLSSGHGGTLPSELGLLSRMAWLEVFSERQDGEDELIGTIPTQLGLLRNMTEFRLKGNRLWGPIPSELGMLDKLAMLSLRNIGSLTGTLPTQLGQLQQLKKLWLEDNAFIGSIPSQFGAMKDLKELKLSSNSMLTGSIPSSLEEITTLTILNVSDTAIVGTIPSQLCHLTGSNLLLFDCSASLLCGCNCSCSSGSNNDNGRHHNDLDNFP